MSNKAFHSNNDFSHQAITDHFKKQKFYGYDNELSYLDFFLKKKKDEKEIQEIRFSDSYGNCNTPLIVTGDEGCGKTSLVVQWLKNISNPPKTQLGQQPVTKNHVVIYHFAGVSNCDLKYQSFIFRTLVKLRQEYDIQHRVEIIDDKLRMNFSRWLELASQKHEERLDPDSKVILILDGLENFHDVDTNGEESADWIPWTFPNHIKVILMTKKNSKAMNHFKLRKYPIIYMNGVSPLEIQSMLDDYLSLDIGKQLSQRQIDLVKQTIISRMGGSIGGLYHGDSFVTPSHANAGELIDTINNTNNGVTISNSPELRNEEDSTKAALASQSLIEEPSQPTFSLFNSLKMAKNLKQNSQNQQAVSFGQQNSQQQQPVPQQQPPQFNPLKSFMSQNSSVSTALKYFVRKNYLKNIVVPADQCDMVSQPFQASINPLIIKCILNFNLVFNKYEHKDEELFRLVPLDINKILECKSLKNLFVLAIQHFRGQLFNISNSITYNNQEELIKFDYLLGYIYISRKGVTELELFELIPSLTQSQFNRFMSLFGFLFVKEQEQIFIKHSSFKKAVRECVNLIHQEDQKIILHRNLSMVIEKESFSLRQIDELSHQYFMGKCWIKLKDLISNIEVFSIMFVPEIKHELAQYWQCLEQHKYDPVAEYNKALEGFVVKYRPNNQELFVILIQLSRFFKELADLETKYTPHFKHPPLRGQSELESITLLGELQKLDDLYNPHANSTAMSSIVGEPLLGDVEHFNVDNTIVREQIMQKIKKELEDQKNEKNRDTLNANSKNNGSGGSQIYYYYKRWIWVQFPWCTIDVYSNLSNIMEMSMGSHTNYISTAKENELVNGTIQILKDAKLRKKNNRAALSSENVTANQSQMNRSKLNGRSHSPSKSAKKLSMMATSPIKMELRQNMQNKKSTTLTINTSGNAPTLPPIGPQTAKNNQNAQQIGQSLTYKSRFQNSRTYKQDAFRSSSAGGLANHYGGTSQHQNQRTSGGYGNQRNLLSLSLDSEDKKSPEKMLIKLTEKINEIEKNELQNLESQNKGMGSDLNQITFQILRKEKELIFLEELYDTLQTEENLNQQEKIKLETTEAKLLKAYENLNRVEVEKKRLEQIFIVCSRNPAKNQEWIRNLESQVESMRKLVKYQELQIQQYKTECEENAKSMIDVTQQMEDKRKLRDQAIYKVSNIIEKKRQLDLRVAEVEEQRVQILKGMEGPEKTINKLKQRQIVYRKWIAKLQVTKAFVNEKKNYYERAFRKITAVTGISNPNDIEGLLQFIERTNDLRKTKQTRERKMEQLKSEKNRLEEELKNIQNGQPQYDHTDIEDTQNKVNEKDKYLRDLRENTQRQLFQIADMKSGILNVAKKIGIRGIELNQSNMPDYIDRLSDKFNLVQKKLQVLQIRGGSDLSLIVDENNTDAHNLSKLDLEKTMNQSIIDSTNDLKEETHANIHDDRVTSRMGGGISSHAETPIRQTRKKQPKQKHTIQSEHSATQVQEQSNQTQANQIAAIFHHHSRIEKAEDSETEERNQMKQDRMKVKQLLGLIQTRNTPGGSNLSASHSGTKKANFAKTANAHQLNSLHNSYSQDSSLIHPPLNPHGSTAQAQNSTNVILINNQAQKEHSLSKSKIVTQNKRISKIVSQNLGLMAVNRIQENNVSQSVNYGSTGDAKKPPQAQLKGSMFNQTEKKSIMKGSIAGRDRSLDSVNKSLQIQDASFGGEENRQSLSGIFKKTAKVVKIVKIAKNN